ncbi:MAG: type II CRISPR RNA-guided endonuclease Cas9, partial [Planctomycetota bacterium]
APHHTLLQGPFREELREAIFHQRPLRSQKGLIGRCFLERGQPRAPVALLSAQRFRYLQKLNDLVIELPDGSSRGLTPDERTKLVALFESTGDVTFAGLRKALKDKKAGKNASEYGFNLERGGEKKLPGNRTNAKLEKALGEHWQKLSPEQRDAVVVDLVEYENRDALARRLEARYGLPAEIAAQAADLTLEPAYFSLSACAIRKLLPRMEAGISFATARKEIYGELLAESAVHDKLPPVLEVNPDLRNPVVCRALTELRKVVNAIVREYGKPALVRVELARDMKRSRKQRDDIWKENRQNEKRREEAKKRILKELGEGDPRPGDVLKVLLAEECGWKCPYTGRQISMSALIGASPQFDIEHILPFSQSLDNSFANKTLCYHEENRNRKLNRTPHKAYAGDPARYEEILARVATFFGPHARSKLMRFRMEEIPGDFVDRQLNDTRYMSRLAGDYVGLLFGGQIDREGRRRVQTTPGRITAYLREAWKLDSILAGNEIQDAIPHDPRSGAKNRGDHRHHAIDAVVIALTDVRAVQALTRAAERAADIGRRLLVDAVDPWTGFCDAVRESIARINVSFRVDRRVSGPFHEETNYGPPRDEDDGSGRRRTCCCVRKPLQNMSKDEVANIVDPVVRQLVQDKLTQLAGEPKRAFADAANHPYLRTKDGRLIPIHKARIRKVVSTVAVGGNGSPRYVAPGSNHHMEIVAECNAAGVHARWLGKTVSLLEA